MSRTLIRLMPFAAAFLCLSALTPAQPVAPQRTPSSAADDLTQLRAAAERGSAKAQNALGERYAKGAGVTQDPAQAVQWYRMAAEQGDADEIGRAHD